MKKLTALSATLLLSISTISYGASLNSMDKNQTTQSIQDKTIKTASLSTIDGKVVENAFTGFFSNDGKIKGKFAKKPSNEPQIDEGTWTVKDDGTLCVTWQHWNQKSPLCMATYSLPNGMMFINSDDNAFVSIVLQDGVKSGDQMHK